MPRKLTVWATVHHAIAFRGHRPTAVQVAIAAPSRAAAARAFGISSRYLAEYGFDTGNEECIAAAMACPGELVWQDRHGGPWRHIRDADIVGALPQDREPVPPRQRRRPGALERALAAQEARRAQLAAARSCTRRMLNDWIPDMEERGWWPPLSSGPGEPMSDEEHAWLTSVMEEES